MSDKQTEQQVPQPQGEKKKKQKNVPVCPHRFEPGELQFTRENMPADWKPDDELDKRNFYRQAAQLHKQVRAYARELIKPGVSLYDVSEKIEARLREVCGNTSYATCQLGHKSKGEGYYIGQAFPLGVSVNDCAAHYAALENDDHVVGQKDVIKVDFGIHCNGYLVDSAFTLHWDPELDPIVEASRDATNSAIKHAGADVLLSELGNIIEEVICSYEYRGRALQPVRNLCGHMVDRYTIHASKSIPLYKNDHCKDRMEAGECYACETFASSGRGRISDRQPTSHYMVAPEAIQLSKGMVGGTDATRALFDLLKKSFHTLAWNPKWLKHLGVERYALQLDSLVKQGYVNDYPQMVDKAGCYVSQFEHTFMVSDWGKEVFTRGDDY